MSCQILNCFKSKIYANSIFIVKITHILSSWQAIKSIQLFTLVRFGFGYFIYQVFKFFCNISEYFISDHKKRKTRVLTTIQVVSAFKLFWICISSILSDVVVGVIVVRCVFNKFSININLCNVSIISNKNKLLYHVFYRLISE